MLSVGLRPMTEADLPLVADWLEQPHVARWWTPDTTGERELDLYRRRISGDDDRTHLLVIEVDGRPVGWCQWYVWEDYPDEAAAYGTRAGEVGIDYAIGEPDAVGRGVGTRVVRLLVAEAARTHPGAGAVTAPEEDNAASRRVLEKNGFELVEIRPIVTELHDRPMAIYRLAGS